MTPSSPPRSRRPPWILAGLGLLPLVWLWATGDRFAGRPDLDLVGHVWMVWSGGHGPVFQTPLLGWPDGCDLLPILGGWLDVLLGMGLVRLGLPVAWAWNVVCAVWLALAGVGGAVLARVFGVSWRAAVVAGVLAQLDGYMGFHMQGGRLEQAGVGAMALAVAGAVAAWRTGSLRVAVATGVAGAAVVWTSWELGVILMGGMGILAPGLWRGPRGPRAVRAWLVAAGTTALLAGPWAAFFLVHALAVRPSDEGTAQAMDAASQAAPLLRLFWGGFRAPSTWVTLALFALPWTARGVDSAFGRAVGILLLLSWLAAAGPTPGVWSPGDLGLPVGLWSAYQALPVFGWFHSPQRVLVWWSLAAPVAAALAVDRLRMRRLGWVLAGGFVLASVVQLARAPWRISQTWTLPSSDALADMADDPVAGAVYELPVVRVPADLPATLRRQMVHGRPIPYPMALPTELRHTADRLEAELSLARWMQDPARRPPPERAVMVDELTALRERGVRWLLVDPERIPGRHLRPAIRALRASLGPPTVASEEGWRAWRLDD